MRTHAHTHTHTHTQSLQNLLIVHSITSVSERRLQRGGGGGTEGEREEGGERGREREANISQGFGNMAPLDRVTD